MLWGEGSNGARGKFTSALRRCGVARELNLEDSRLLGEKGMKGAREKSTSALRRCDVARELNLEGLKL